MAPRRNVDPGALVASVGLHALLLGLGALWVARSLQSTTPTPANSVAIDIDTVQLPTGVDLPPMRTGTLLGRDTPRDAKQAKVPPGGGERVPRPDSTRAGHGGSDEAAEPALNLADQNDGLTLDRDPFNSPVRSQVQRLETSNLRRSLDDRRATPNPMELDFVATGPGRVAERRPVSRYNPGSGELSGTRVAMRGGELGGPDGPPGGLESLPGASQLGESQERTAAGLTGSVRGAGVARSASVMLARPSVPRARAAVPAPARGQAQDTVDSRQEVASAVRSLIHASGPGALRRATGPGGTDGDGAPASGGRQGPGSTSAAAGYGPGRARDGSGDPRLTGYFRNIERKVEPHWRDAFPDWAIAQGRGGLATLRITLSPGGDVMAVSVHRSSGISEFDENVMRAVRRAGPFGPLPSVYARRPLTLHMAFDAVNPAIGRDGPGPGTRRSPSP
ncbi:MAG: energy transducer TonB [Polyangiaceae bacterium]